MKAAKNHALNRLMAPWSKDLSGPRTAAGAGAGDSDQVSYIIDHADDTLVLVEEDLVPLAEKLARQVRGVKAWVVLCDGAMPAASLSPAFSYEELVADADADRDFPNLDERTASGMCFTSATTGDPKGVLYSHGSIVLHALALP